MSFFLCRLANKTKDSEDEREVCKAANGTSSQGESESLFNRLMLNQGRDKSISLCVLC